MWKGGEGWAYSADRFRADGRTMVPTLLSAQRHFVAGRFISKHGKQVWGSDQNRKSFPVDK